MTQSDIDPFTQGYVEALFASAAGAQWPNVVGIFAGRAVSDPPGFSDLSPEALAAILKYRGAWKRDQREPDTQEHGARFWRESRNGFTGHFRGMAGNALRRMRYPPLTVSLGDDGKVRLTIERAEAGR